MTLIALQYLVIVVQIFQRIKTGDLPANEGEDLEGGQSQ
jgi:hypothetical protein